MSHGPHPAGLAAGLADGCYECAEAAETPFTSLDDAVLGDLIERTLRNRFGGGSPRSSFGDGVAPRSDLEARAMAVIMTALEQAARLAKTRPELVATYLRERWAVALPRPEEEET